jgi:acyl carrier protein
MQQPRPLPPPETLEPQLVTLISERLLETGPGFNADTDLYSVGLDSMAIMQLLILVEEEYGVALPECALTRQNFTTVRNLADLIRKQAAGIAII